MPEPNIRDVYIDESSQNNHRFLVLGGIVSHITNSKPLVKDLIEARKPELPAGEAKWGKVSKAKLPAYKKLVDVLFGLPKIVHFHSLVIDTSKVDHKRFNAGSREIGFNKEIYQLA